MANDRNGIRTWAELPRRLEAEGAVVAVAGRDRERLRPLDTVAAGGRFEIDATQ